MQVYSQCIGREEEFGFFGESGVQQVQSSSTREFKFSTCDSILNIGPISDLALGSSNTAASAQDYLDHAFQPEVEVVTCTGYGRNGALCVLQENVRPSIVSTWDRLHGYDGVWSFHCRMADEMEDMSAEEYHNVVIASSSKHTTVRAFPFPECRCVLPY